MYELIYSSITFKYYLCFSELKGYFCKLELPFFVNIIHKYNKTEGKSWKYWSS